MWGEVGHRWFGFLFWRTESGRKAAFFDGPGVGLSESAGAITGRGRQRKSLKAINTANMLTVKITTSKGPPKPLLPNMARKGFFIPGLGLWVALRNTFLKDPGKPLLSKRTKIDPYQH